MPESELFFIRVSGAPSPPSLARRAVKLIVLLGVSMSIAGTVLVAFASLTAAALRARIAGLAFGLPLIYIGSHIAWAGIGSLRGLEERMEGVEAVE